MVAENVYIDEELEERLVLWIYEKRNNMLHISRKMIMFKAKKMYDEKNKDQATQEGFTASRGWWVRKIHEEARFFA